VRLEEEEIQVKRARPDPVVLQDYKVSKVLPVLRTPRNQRAVTCSDSATCGFLQGAPGPMGESGPVGRRGAIGSKVPDTISVVQLLLTPEWISDMSAVQNVQPV
ncbi:hypothetical protein XENOCAPTIV_020974, partial [Xenoophorus captivus]